MGLARLALVWPQTIWHKIPLYSRSIMKCIDERQTFAFDYFLNRIIAALLLGTSRITLPLLETTTCWPLVTFLSRTGLPLPNS